MKPRATPHRTSKALRVLLLTVGLPWAAFLDSPAAQAAGTTVPLLDPRYSYAADRHEGETRRGSLGIIAKHPTESAATLTPRWTARDGGRGVLDFSWSFRSGDLEEFAGFYLSAGRIGIDTVHPDGTPGPALDFHHQGTLNFRSLSRLAGPPVTVQSLRLRLRGNGVDQQLVLRLELEDADRHKSAHRVPLALRGSEPQTLEVPIAAFGNGPDLQRVKLAAVVVERLHLVDGIRNPDQGGFEVEGLDLVAPDASLPDAPALLALSDRDFVAALARADFEALWTLADPTTGASYDRTLFPDLLHWGATGWQLAALPAGVRHGWITREQAIERTLRILRFLDQDMLWGDEPTGRVGNSIGLVYRFGGIGPTGPEDPLTGTRKIDVNRVNAVEASTIDTALLHWGILLAEASFEGTEPDEAEIRTRGRSIRNRTRWPLLVDPVTGQLRMGWKPERQIDDPFFATPAEFGGFWTSRDGTGARVLTIDYLTSEGQLAALLAVGSESHPVSADVWYSMIRSRSAPGAIVRTWPGAWFTYSFLTAAYLPTGLGPDFALSRGTTPVDWIANSVAACQSLRSLSPPGRLILPDALELPDTTYAAQGRPAVAVDSRPAWTGTITPYSVQSVLGLDHPATAADALAELRALIRETPEIWDPLVGVLDSLHPDLATFPPSKGLRRTTGRWVQNQVWPLNKGIALLAELNWLDDGVVRKAASRHPVLQRALASIYSVAPKAPRQVLIVAPWGHDAWSAALGASQILVVDHYAEMVHRATPNGEPLPPISREDIGAALDRLGLSVERSGGPAGLRDAAILPDGTPLVLVAGPGDDVLLRVADDGALSLFATGFEASARGDDTGVTRLAVGGQPALVAVSLQWPTGVGLFDAANGEPRGTLPLPERPAGLAFEPGSNRLFILSPDGSLVVHPDPTQPTLPVQPLATLPVGGRDLAYDAFWRVDAPHLVAVGTDGTLHTVRLSDASLGELTGENLAGVSGLDIRGDRAVLAQDESARLDIVPARLHVSLEPPRWDPASRSFRAAILFEPADSPVPRLIPEASNNLHDWFPAGTIRTEGDALVLEHGPVDPGSSPSFHRLRLE